MFIYSLFSILSRENLDRSQSLKTALIWLNDIGRKKYECSLDNWIDQNYKLRVPQWKQTTILVEIQVTAAVK